MPDTDPLTRAVSIFGTKKALAEKMGISPMAVTKWGKSQVPLERAFEIERLTAGEVTAAELRPDVLSRIAG